MTGIHQFGIHHHPCNSAISVQKRVHFADNKHDVSRPGKGMLQYPVKIESLYKCAFHQVKIYKGSIACKVVTVYELAGIFLMPRTQLYFVSSRHYFQKIGCRLRR